MFEEFNYSNEMADRQLGEGDQSARYNQSEMNCKANEYADKQ